MRKYNFMQRVVYRVAFAFAYVVFKWLMPARIHGDISVLHQGGCLYYSNHISLLDPFLTHFLVMPRRVNILAKKELFGNRLLAYLVDALGAVSVDRGNSDLAAVKTILDLLKHGEMVSIYPEGTRVRNEDLSLGEFQSGVAMIALRSKVPVVPVYFDHGNKYRLFHPFDVYIGKVLDLSAYEGKKIHKEDLESVTNLMYSSLSDLRKIKE